MLAEAHSGSRGHEELGSASNSDSHRRPSGKSRALTKVDILAML